MRIRLATPDDVDEYFSYTQAQFRESGTDGDLIFHPVQDFESRNKEEEAKKWKAGWAKAVTETGWQRDWILEDGKKILGAASLHGHHLPVGLHRAWLGLGLLRPARGKGQGRALMNSAIAWAREQPTLEWMDLYVFAHNAPARALYKSLGFFEIGTTDDLFRINGQSVSDVHMALRLKGEK